MKAPQIIMIVLLALDLLLNAHHHGKPRQPSNFWICLIGCAITVVLLYWGGFFTN